MKSAEKFNYGALLAWTGIVFGALAFATVVTNCAGSRKASCYEIWEYRSFNAVLNERSFNRWIGSDINEVRQFQDVAAARAFAASKKLPMCEQ